MMNKTIGAIAITAAVSMLVGLSACSSGGESDHAHADHETDAHSAVDPADSGSALEEASVEPVGAETPRLEETTPSADYPLTTCVVSGGPLDSMGGPIAFSYGDEEVQFCCKGCIGKFEKSPETYLAKVRSARK